jgi:propionyl-CoA synthetase
MGYADVYKAWKADPEGFWMQAAEAVHWERKPSKALFDDRAPIYEWFADGLTNTCYNAVDRHVEAGRGDQTAIIHDSPITHTKHEITYRRAEGPRRHASPARSARQGRGKGRPGDHLHADGPRGAGGDAGLRRLGAIHSVVFGGFAAHELAVRIDDATPKAIIAASCGIEPGRVVHYKPLLDGALDRPRPTSPSSA